MEINNETLFIFEIANNHQGSLSHGVKIIEALAKVTKRFGIKSCVKLQYRDLNSIIHKDYRSSDIKHIKRFNETRLEDHEFKTLVNKIKENGMITMCTPFDENSVDKILNHGIDIIKVASCSANDWPLLEKITKQKNDVICSTGGLNIQDIDKIISFFNHRNKNILGLLHCVGIYPTPIEKLHLNIINKLSKRYRNIKIGYSGHEDPENHNVVQMAIAKGACILERHVGIEIDENKLNAYSLNEKQFNDWVRSALNAGIMNGVGEEKNVTKDEKDSMESLSRGVYASKKIIKGNNIVEKDVYFAMPLNKGQLKSSEYNLNIKSSKNYFPDECIKEEVRDDKYKYIRSKIHNLRGLLNENKIYIGNDFNIELSHHYGIEDFDKFGCIIINLINREYCKKLIYISKNQEHPVHYHLKKEESFQILHGSLNLELDGNSYFLKEGQVQLIERKQLHSFSTKVGCVFEEISTTHYANDSYYSDHRISQIDPLKRKSFLENW